MWITKVSFNNFKPYKEESISFHNESKNNISIIEGVNGAGKTSFLEGVKWCLYEEKGTTYSDTYDMIYRYEDVDEMSVKIWFKHQGKRYVVTRKAVPTKKKIAKVKLELKKNEKYIFENESKERKQKVINRILPENLHQFFLLKGERTEYLANNLDDEKFKEEILQLLGLKSVMNGKNDLKDKVKKSYRKEYQNLKAGEEEADELIEEKKVLVNDKRTYIEKKEEKEEELGGKKTSLDKINKKLDDLGGIEELMNEKDELLSYKKDLEHEKEEKEKNLNKLMKKNYLYLLEDQISKYKEKLEHKVSKLQKKEKENIKKEYKIKLVEGSIDDGSCKICGQSTKKIKTELNDSLDRYNSSMAGDYDVANRLGKKKNEFTELDKIINKIDYKNPVRIKEEIDGIEEQIDEIDKEIKTKENEMGSKDKRYKTLKEEKGKIKANIDELEEIIEENEKYINELDDEIEELDDEIDRKTPSSREEEILKKKIDFTKNIVRKLKTIEKEGIRKKRKSILEEMNEILETLTDGERNFTKIDFKSEGSYAPQLFTPDGKKPNMEYDISDGEKWVVAYTFLLGLNRYTERNAPLILDVPFSELDKEYRENLSILLGDLNNQVILLVKDTSRAAGDVRSLLERNKNKEMELMRDTDKNITRIKEVE